MGSAGGGQGVGYRPFVLGLAGALTVGGVGFGMACAMPHVLEMIGTPLEPPLALEVDAGMGAVTSLPQPPAPAPAELPGATVDTAAPKLPNANEAGSSAALVVGTLGGMLAGGALVGLELILGCGTPGH